MILGRTRGRSYIVAGDRREYLAHVRDCAYRYTAGAYYVDSPEALDGVPARQIKLVGTWADRPDAAAILGRLAAALGPSRPASAG